MAIFQSLAILLVALSLPGTTLAFLSPALRASLSSPSSESNIQRLRATSSSSSSSSSDDADGGVVDRRTALERSGAAVLSSLLLSSGGIATMNPRRANADADFEDGTKKRILITGSNSGIGLDAAQRMASRGHEIVLACVS
mmetsp:Transcript_11725/g.22187  ORF Transcript_11725/g.22187 Transcript_11725/m.22187 type:complete len:141 (-) Transcript_11725:2555-2977(-)